MRNAAPLADKSRAMQLAESLGFGRLAWSLRRMHCPVGADALVLEVGAGGNPYARANVLLDGFELSPERMEADLVRDRPLVIGRCENLPFADKSFDFIVASHVLEHSSDPDSFLKELMRVGRAGYIETPEAFYERIDPFIFHRLEVTEESGALLITKKPVWNPDPDLKAMYERKLKRSRFFRSGNLWPDALAIRFYWTDKIPYVIANPQTDCAWELPAMPKGASAPRARIVLRGFMRTLFSQRSRNRKLDLMPILRCVQCRQTACKRVSNSVVRCGGCGREYEISNGAIIMERP